MDYKSDNKYVYQYCLLSPAFFVTPVNLKTVLSQPENEAKYDDSATTMCGCCIVVLRFFRLCICNEAITWLDHYQANYWGAEGIKDVRLLMLR